MRVRRTRRHRRRRDLDDPRPHGHRPSRPAGFGQPRRPARLGSSRMTPEGSMTTTAVQAEEHRYAHPEALVEPEWLAEHLGDPRLQVIEVDVNPTSYEAGHL